MPRVLVLILLLASATVASGQTVYYATSTGENYAKVTWHSSTLAAFKAAPPENVYESYTVERRADGSTVVHRDFSTPSGDWGFELTYEYDRDARLQKVLSVFVTFGGINTSGEAEGLTRCERTLIVLLNGTLQMDNERITDAKTGKAVARQFYQPKVDHWMSLRDLPIPPKI